MPGTASQKLATLRAQLGGVLRGKADIVHVAALAGGHVLLEDAPGNVVYASIDDRDGEACRSGSRGRGRRRRRRRARPRDVEVPGQKVTSAFGPVRLSVGGGTWVLQEDTDGLIELRVTSPTACAYLGDVALGDAATLLVGDALSTERGGPPVLKVLG